MVEWESLQWDCEELDIPIEKVWPAHIANHPEAALNIDSEYRVEPNQHLPGAVHGCLVACRICDQRKGVVDRCTEWEEAQERAKAQAQAERRRRVEKQVAAARAARQAKEEQREVAGSQSEQGSQHEEQEQGSGLVVDRGREIVVTGAHVVVQAGGEGRGRLLRLWRGVGRRGEDRRAVPRCLVDGLLGTAFARVWVIEG
jgi:S1-C subfamily serine protease